MDNVLFHKPELQLLHKLRTAEPNLYFQLVKTYLSNYLDDIPPDSLTVNYFSKTASTRKSRRIRLGSLNRTPTTGVIGAPLTQEGICRVYQLIEYIARDENICKKNLFRRPGNFARQENLKFKMNSGAPLDIDAERINVYDCCEVLKRFLAELQEPLLPSDIYNVFRIIPDMIKKATTGDQRTRIQARQLFAACLLLLLVPTESYLLLHNVLTLLTSIIEHKEDNLTNAEALSVLFTPSVLLPRKLSGSEMTKELPFATQVMTFLIQNMPTLFEPPASLIADVNLQLKNIEEGSINDVLCLPVRIAYCHPTEDATSEDYTEIQLKKLQCDMDSIPECPQKKLFYKKLKEQKNELTPTQRNNNSSPSYSSRATLFTEPIRKYFTKRSLKRKHLFPADADDRLSLSLTDAKNGSPILTVSRKKSSHC